jgi:endoglucanase
MSKLWSLMALLGLLGALGGCRPIQAPLPSTVAGLPIEGGDLPPQPVAGAADPFAQNRRLGRGINLGNALEAPAEGEWGVTLQAEYFLLIRQRGFDSVRIPVRWSSHAAATPPFTIEPRFLARVEWAVDQALKNDLLVVLNVHHYDELHQSPDAHRDRFLALWRQIAEHFRGYDDRLLFELLNEPHDRLTAATWNALAAEAIRDVRVSNPQRTLVLGPVNWNGIDRLSALELPADERNLIVTVHYYLPFQFTHQGAEWVSGSALWRGTRWDGSDAARAAVARDLDRAAAWGRQHGRPIYLGEFGAYSKADMDSRARWTAAVARLAEERGFSWAYWEFCAGFGIYQPATGEWRWPLVQALVGQTE